MAAMVGISGATATGSAAATTATGVEVGSKTTALLKVIGIKSAAILKSLGIIKSTGIIIVVGTATIATIVLSEKLKKL